MFEDLKEKVIAWAVDRGIGGPSSSDKQLIKIGEELGELYAAHLKQDEAKRIDSVGDLLVTIIIYSKQQGIDPVKSLESAYNEIKDRKGETVEGTFIKE